MFFTFAKKYLYRIRYYIIFSALVYFVSIFLGCKLASISPDEANKIIDEFRKMVGSADKAAPLELFAFIFFKNAFSSFLAVFAGIIFGILPFLSLIGNGAFLGVFAYFFIKENFSLAVFLAGTLPHGIIEIPAFLFSAAAGLWLGMAVFRRIIFMERKFRSKVKGAIKFYFFIILPLLFIAALIEAFITPKIIEFTVKFF